MRQRKCSLPFFQPASDSLPNRISARAHLLRKRAHGLRSPVSPSLSAAALEVDCLPSVCLTRPIELRPEPASDPLSFSLTAVWTWIDRCNESLLFPSPDNDRDRQRSPSRDRGQGAGCLFADYQISFCIDTVVV